MKKYLVMKVLLTFIGIFALTANSFAAKRQLVYVYKGGEIVYQTTAETLDSVALEQSKTIISLYSKNGTQLYSAAYSNIDSITYVTLPMADMLDVQFNSDGTATDISPMANPIETVPSTGLSTYYNNTYGRYVARFENPWASIATAYYKMDYTNNQTFKDLLSNGHSLEMVVMADYSGTILDKECKPFSSMQSGGTGFMVTKILGARQNEWCFLPNISTTGSSTWRWTTSSIVPETKVYYHLVGVWNKTDQKAEIYVNGQLKNTIDAPGNFVFPSTAARWFAIGCDPSSTGGEAAWCGDIVLARIYSNALNDDQVGKLWEEIKVQQEKAATQMVSNVSFDKEYQMKAGSIFKINGSGFKEGDKVVIYNDNVVVASLDATLSETGVSIALPTDLTSGTYTLNVNRSGEEQYLGTNAFEIVETLPAGSKVIAHRGSWTNLTNQTQNSVESLQKALDMGVYGSETDVWITTDGHLMVNHDASFNGVTIETSSSESCNSLKLSNGETMPKLNDFLNVLSLSDSPTKLIIEIKTHASSERGLAAAMGTVDLVKAYKMQDRVEYISFNLGICKKLVELDPMAKVSYLNGDMTPQQLNDLHISGLDYTAAQFRANPTWITNAHDLGMTTNVWTLDSKPNIIEFNNLRADYITTNYPEIAAEVKKHYEDVN